MYEPGPSETRTAESGVAAKPQENAPTAADVEAIRAFPFHPVLACTNVEVPSLLARKSCSLGSGSVPGTPNAARAGPDPRISTVLAVVPPITNPAISMLPPVPTLTLAERLTSRGDEAVSVPAAVAS